MNPRLAAILAGICLLCAAVFFWSDHERQIGRLSAQLATVTALHATATARADTAVTVAALARDSASLLRQEARNEQARDAQQRHHTDSILTESHNEAARAQAILADSAATTLALRGEIGRLVSNLRADSVSLASERHERDVLVGSLWTTIRADSTAIQKGLEAERLLLARALSSENQVSVLRKQLPSQAGSVLKGVVLVAAGIGFGRLLR